jgi:glucose-6-phosphate isomerase
MDRLALLQALQSHPMSGWRRADSAARPAVDPAARTLWCGIGGSLLPSETLLRAFGSTEQNRRWTSLGSPEALALDLQPGDQPVFASKSGKTLELWTWIARLRALPGWDRVARPIAITQDDDNPLAALARREGWPIASIPVDVGGRFSAFTPIGTLPLAWLGRDPQAFVDAGRRVTGQVEAGSGFWHEQVWTTVDRFFEGYLRGTTEWVLMPYSMALENLSAWWVQLVAESLGKVARDGTRRGFTPIRAVGPVDQHSQLQRWMAGPRNLGVIVVTVEDQDHPERLDPPAGCPYPRLRDLRGDTILRAQAEGTAEALEAAGIPTIRWSLPAITEAELGAFMMAWQWTVGLLGFALELDPFDQPAVEDGKKRTFAKLGLHEEPR